MRPRLERLCHSTFGNALVGAALLWLALPLAPSLSPCFGPLSPNVDVAIDPGAGAPLPGPWFSTTAWLAWLAPVWWVVLARRRELPGRRPYGALWLVGLLFWLAELYWLTLPYWATSLGWVVLSCYLAFYLPVFMGLVRVAVHRLRVPVIVAAPVVWTGLELAQAHLLTGFAMAGLAHTQYRWLELIQLSDLAGAYGVSFVVMWVAACLARMLPLEGRRGSLWPVLPGTALVAAALVYGHVRLNHGRAAESSSPPARIALIQGSIDVQVKSNPEQQQQIMDDYCGLSSDAVARYERLDLLVWPETMFRSPLFLHDAKVEPPPDWAGSPEQFQQWIEKRTRTGPSDMGVLARRLKTPLLLGVDTYHFRSGGAVDAYNSAVLVDRRGAVVARYDKMHPVMFGEYIPFARAVPLLQELTPIGAGLMPGRQPVAIRVGSILVSPNICYESVLSHVIRRSVNRLAAERREPDALINLTNDGWYYGASELDLHLLCGVFRAVECRKPLLIAANTGFSASIDGDGRIVALGPRHAEGHLLAEVRPDSRTSWYLRHGDWLAGSCLAACLLFGMVGLWRPKSRRPSSRENAPNEQQAPTIPS